MSAVGIVVVTHGPLAEELVRSAEMIVGSQEGVRAVGLRSDEEVDAMKGRIESAIREVDRGRGVLVLTDMFGGTPSNLSLSLHREGAIEIVTGVNLPMLLKLAGARNPEAREGEAPPSLSELASAVADHGRKNIQVATEILRR